MDKKTLDPGVQKAVSAILSVINRQRPYQGKGFGHKSKWATIVVHADHNIQIIPIHVKSKGIDATAEEVKMALDILQQTKDFDSCIRVRYENGNAVLFDKGNGVSSDIKFD